MDHGFCDETSRIGFSQKVDDDCDSSVYREQSCTFSENLPGISHKDISAETAPELAFAGLKFEAIENFETDFDQKLWTVDCSTSEP